MNDPPDRTDRGRTTATPRPTAVLFQTRFFDRGAARLFDRLRRQGPPGFECFVLMHAPPGTPKPPMFRAGSTPNRLYRPVKPFKFWPEFKPALWEARVWQGARRRELFAWPRGLGKAARG